VHQRHASSRRHGFAWRLPAVILSGLFMVVSAGLPALASTAQTRELPVEAKQVAGGAVMLTATQELPEVVTASPTPTSEAGLLPSSSTGTVVDPLDLYRLPTWHGPDPRSVASGSMDAAHPDRAPPTGPQ
jgi:hypothetical protein